MKAPNVEALKSLSKAQVTDPVIAGTASNASQAIKAGGAGLASSASKTKFTIRLDAELLGRIRAAYLAEIGTGEGVGSLSEWAASRLEDAVKVTEARLHGDRPFVPVGVGQVPRLPLSGQSERGL